MSSSSRDPGRRMGLRHRRLAAMVTDASSRQRVRRPVVMGTDDAGVVAADAASVGSGRAVAMAPMRSDGPVVMAAAV